MIGTYVLRDELLLATPPPHPSEGPPVNPNPLNTTIAPPTAGVKLSFAILAPSKHASYQHQPARPGSPSSHASNTSSASHSHASADSCASKEADPFRTNGLGTGSGEDAPVVFGSGNPALAGAVNGKEGKDAGKRRKPKNSMVKSSSTFISRVIPHEGLKERLQEHAPEGLFAFANINRAFQWLDLSSATKVRFPPP
jgi:hypothetical protein